MDFFETPLFRFLALILMMVVAGVLGSAGRQYFDVQPLSSTDQSTALNLAKPKFREIAIPGLVGSFVIPLFLSLGKSAVLSNVINGKEVYENILVVFGFCLLGAISAKSFVSGLAHRALRLAGEAKEDANAAKQDADQAKEKATEARDFASESAENTTHWSDELPSSAEARITPDGLEKELLENASDNVERAIIEAFIKRPKIKRATSSLSAELEVQKPQLYRAIDRLVGKKVAQAHKSRTGSILYRLSDGYLKEFM